MEYDVKHEHVICDETKNKEIFLNLISNAVKYTASGGRVTIRITEIDCDREDCVRIQTQVIDTGIGMSEEFLPSLFEAFARERNTTDGKIAGTGLGMPIIKKYIDMMYGTIEVESKQGEGSKFTVTLEYRIADKSYYERATEKFSDMDETRISGKHILLAEDNDLNAEIAQFILEDMGLIVDRVEDGVQCVSRIEQKPAGTYDLILMDIMLGDMEGFEVIKRLRNQGISTPVMIVSGRNEDYDSLYGLSLGADDYITKPFRPLVLGAKVKALIRRNKNLVLDNSDTLECGPFSYDTTTMRFYKNGEELILSSKESALLLLFMKHPQQVFTKDMIYEHVWGNTVAVDDNAIMVYINRLRGKIEDDRQNPAYILTIRGLGYRFVP